MSERALSKDEKIALYEDMLGITEDRDRYARLRDTYGMSPGATWLLSRLVAAKGRWLPKLTLLDAIPSPAEDDDRDLSAVKVRVHEVRKTLGRAAVEWDREMGYRLSSAARDRLDREARIAQADVVVQIIPEVNQETAARIVHAALNNPDTLPIDRMRIHGAWRAGGGG